MKKVFYALLSGLFFMLFGCSQVGGNNNNGGGGEVVGDDFSIDLTQIAGYDSNDPINDQYLAVINYLRSLSIQCNDPSALSGPAGVDMKWEDHIAAAAEEHSEDMKLSVWYSHDGSGTANDKTAQATGLARGSTFDERIRHNGYNGGTTAENIATMWSQPNAPSADAWVTAMEGWMKSDHGHCSNIMNPVLTDFGMHESRAPVDANGEYRVYWTQDFGGQ